MFKRSWTLLFIVFIFFSCASTKIGLNKNTRLRFLAEYKIPNDERFQNTLVGGLSGIDYNKKNGECYLISDDRSASNPARFYTARIYLNKKNIDSVRFTAVSYLHSPDQKVYPRYADDSLRSCDPEAIRFNPARNEWTWCSEGERSIRPGAAYLRDPWIYDMDQEGFFKDSFFLPANMHVSLSAKGPRRNSCFEGLGFSPDHSSLYVSLEEPLFEDGPQAATGDTGAWTRILCFDTKTKQPLRQFAYRLDPVSSLPMPPGAFKINGISDILAINEQQLLVIERSFSTGVRQNTIKIFLADMRAATDVSAVHSLMERNFTPISKKLVLNMDSMGIYVDNIEGVCLGPKLPNGKQSLLFISDNNFNSQQVTQLLLFEID